MATDLLLYIDDQPGELARLGAALGRAGVNLEGLCAMASGGGRGEVHLLVDDADAAFTALAGLFQVAAEQEVIVIDLEDRPGALGAVAGAFGRASVNITTAYLATSTRLVVAADDLAKARACLAGTP